MIATNGAEPYKSRVQELFPTMLQQIGGRATGTRFSRCRTWMPAPRHRSAKPSRSTWSTVGQGNGRHTRSAFLRAAAPGADRAAWSTSAVRMYFLHKAFPDLVSPEYTLRAVNYILGTHPVSSTSYMSAVGTVSKIKMYGNNRADNTFIPGAVIPGYVVIRPDFPECIDDFGFLWFEDEYVISVTGSWVLAATPLMRSSGSSRRFAARLHRAGIRQPRQGQVRDPIAKPMRSAKRSDGKPVTLRTRASGVVQPGQFLGLAAGPVESLKTSSGSIRISCSSLVFSRYERIAYSLPDQVAGYMDRGQGGIAELRELDVVESGHRNVLRHAQSPFADFPQGAHRHEVVHTHDGGQLRDSARAGCGWRGGRPRGCPCRPRNALPPRDNAPPIPAPLCAFVDRPQHGSDGRRIPAADGRGCKDSRSTSPSRGGSSRGYS